MTDFENMPRPSEDSLSEWQVGVQTILTASFDKQTGRRILLPFIAGLSTSFLTACRPPRRTVELVGDEPAQPPPEPNFALENEASLHSVEDVIVRLIQSTFRPRYRGIFAPWSAAQGAQTIKQNLQRVGVSPNFVPTPSATSRYNHFLAHPSYLGQIRGSDFSPNNGGRNVVNFANYNIDFEPDNTWSQFSIRGESSPDNIPEVSASVKKALKPNGENIYQMPADKLMQAGNLLVVLPRNSEKEYISKTPQNPGVEDHWSVKGVFQPDSAKVSVDFNIYKARGFWSLVLIRPHHTKPPQT